MKRRSIFYLVAFLVVLTLLGGTIFLGWRYLLAEEANEGNTLSVDMSSLERTLVGLYLGFRQEEIESPASDDSTPILFTITPGETAATIATRLERAGLIRDAGLFRLLVRYRGVDGQLEAGDYQLRPNMSLEEIVDLLQHGRPSEVIVTIPEGWRAEEIAEMLEKRGLVKAEEFLQTVREGEFEYDFLSDRPNEVSLEGYLFPDTYGIPPDFEAAQIIDMMLADFGRRFTPEMRQEAAQRGMSIHEVLTVASLVEREARILEERPIIASVYLNRLEAGWLLESDATAQYALGYQEETGRWWKSPISLEEMTQVDSPYNTYLYPGLPPGPICNPGLASIQAVINPAETKYMYFYHKGDGSHAFAETYEEHLENQRRYAE